MKSNERNQPAAPAAEPVNAELAGCCKLCGSTFRCDNGMWFTTCECARLRPEELRAAQAAWDAAKICQPVAHGIKNVDPYHWACECDYLNTGPVCTHCGKLKPAETASEASALDMLRQIAAEECCYHVSHIGTCLTLSTRTPDLWCYPCRARRWLAERESAK